MRHRGLLFIVSAPSGGGKTTLCKKLLLTFHNSMAYSISVTTRKPRPGEKNGRDYWFVSNKQFFDMRKRKLLAEWAKVHDHYYGTPVKFMDDAIASGKDVLLDLDIKGAMKLKEKYHDAVCIFVAPPSWVELEERIRLRNQDSNKEIQRRLKNARKEMKFMPLYDHVIINQKLSDALNVLKSIVIVERNRIETERYGKKIK